MRRIFPPVLLLLFLWVLARWGGAPVDPTPLPSEGQTLFEPEQSAQGEEGGSSRPAKATKGPAAYTEARAYRMVLDVAGSCSLEAVEELKGDFRRPRRMKWLSGMFCCRLLSSDGRLLEEATLEAPDQVCVVLDPMVADEAGEPTPSRLTAEGPTVFQVRLPKVDDAAVLEVIRLAGAGEPEGNARPLGQLVAAIDLTR